MSVSFCEIVREGFLGNFYGCIEGRDERENLKVQENYFPPLFILKKWNLGPIQKNNHRRKINSFK